MNIKEIKKGIKNNKTFFLTIKDKKNLMLDLECKPRTIVSGNKEIIRYDISKIENEIYTTTLPFSNGISKN